MSDTAVYVITGILAVAAIYLFMRSGSSRSLTEQKQADVKHKRAALIAKRKAEAAEREKAEAPFE